MSSATKPMQTVNSRTFRRALVVTTSLIALTAVILTVYTWRLWAQGATERDDRIVEALVELADAINDDGLDAVIEEGSEEFGPLWPAGEVEYVLEAGDVLTLVIEDETPAVGFPQINAEPGWSKLVVADVPGQEFEQQAVELQVYRVDLGGSVSIVGALPVDEANDESYRFAVSAFGSLLFIALPFAWLASFLISRYVVLRIGNLSETVSRFAVGDLEARAEVGPTKDEFDGVAININQMLVQIRDLMRNLEDVSVGVAHDLKTPLTRLDQRLQSISQDLENPTAIQEHVEASHAHIQTLLNTFNALLRLGDIESGRRRAQFKTVQLSEIVEDMAETYEPVFAESGRNLSLSAVPGLTTSGDRDLIAQLIANLLDNILEHADSNAQAWIRLQPHARGSVLQIGDDGPGIPESEHDRIFDRFYRLDKSRGKPGNGLGLSLVASIAKLHGCEAKLHKQQPGTVIDFVFPHP